MLQLVRNSALFALGQFAEHLQPDISKYHAELLPVLFDYLTQVGGYNNKTIATLNRIPIASKLKFETLFIFCLSSV